MLLTNLNRSLLHGVNEQPLDNIAGLSDTDFNALSVVDSFLINSTLLSFCLDSEDYPYSIEPSPKEQYNPGPNLSGLYFQYGYDYFLAAAPRIINLHLQHKVLLFPSLIIPILDHPDHWYDFQPYLTKIIRKRGQWLSTAKEKWSWWNESMNSAIWADKTNHHRYLYFRLLREYWYADSNALILNSWKEEHTEAKDLCLNLIKEHLSDNDRDLLTKIYLMETGRPKSTIRMLLFWLSNDDKFNDLKGCLAGGQDPHKVLHSIDKDSYLSLYYSSKEDIPTEWILFFDTTSTSGQKKVTQVINKIAPTAGKKQLLYNNLLFGALFCQQHETLLFWINHIWSEQTTFRLERTWILYFNHLDDQTKKQTLLDLINKGNNFYCLHFIFQILDQAIITLDRHTTNAFLSLLKKVANSSNANLKLCLDIVTSTRIPFVLHAYELKTWENISHTFIMHTKATRAKKNITKTTELITFREIIDRVFHE